MDSRSSGAVVLDLLSEKCLARAGDRVGPDVDSARVGMRALCLQRFQYLLHAVEVHRRGSRLRYAWKGGIDLRTVYAAAILDLCGAPLMV